MEWCWQCHLVMLRFEGKSLWSVDFCLKTKVLACNIPDVLMSLTCDINSYSTVPHS